MSKQKKPVAKKLVISLGTSIQLKAMDDQVPLWQMDAFGDWFQANFLQNR